jgi:hypothetical protein
MSEWVVTDTYIDDEVFVMGSDARGNPSILWKGSLETWDTLPPEWRAVHSERQVLMSRTTKRWHHLAKE